MEDFEYIQGKHKEIDENIEYIYSTILQLDENDRDNIIAHVDETKDLIIIVRHELGKIIDEETLPQEALEEYDENLAYISYKLEKLNDEMYENRLYINVIQSLSSSLLYFQESNEEILTKLDQNFEN